MIPDNNHKPMIAELVIREAVDSDLRQLLELYMFLHEKCVPEETEHLKDVWDSIVADENYHLILCEVDGKIAATCTCIILPNLTHNVRAYALVENVVTHGNYRNKGCATACLNYAKQLAQKEDCYKMMLMTGAKDAETLNFYKNAGYNSTDKTAFIQWI